MTVHIEQTDDFEACLALRIEVFVREQGIPFDEEIDDLDAEALHLIAVDDGKPVGTARLIVDGKTGKIGRVCVAKSHRGTGLGAALIKAGLARFEADSGLNRAYLSAQVSAIGFYERLGFKAYGEPYDDAGIPHRDMERPL
ncbi:MULTISPECIES: GNAT family N-acetyltransferase [Halocynthiibacter]|uniref:GNAT family N-acetyltransferase n=1 Tax=Halocynthiibacter halioticoli TaxID=2986804 RepID=A0AAE3IVX3_9RHOB|nr:MULTISPECIES: GNAT family N-acetyltransferase [Halocynthiibacter]MCV6823038.1 GNAT family N-acetyltransferase [Halocynthiibacter halioticoli]MCW4056039.1 GNAT family N-acetyltransferase [Halocynthiibacter sp. SDUM655004]